MMFKLFLKWYRRQRLIYLGEKLLLCKRELEKTDKIHEGYRYKSHSIYWRTEIINLWRYDLKLFKKKNRLEKKIDKLQDRLSR
jgi:hypothetical protein